MEKKTITDVIHPSQQGSFITVPFEVSEKAERLNIQLKVEKDEINTIDLGLEDPIQMRGWSGGARKSIYLRKDRATPGYDLGELQAGTWSVVLNAYKITEACNVEVNIEIITPHERWVKGDLHMHTHHSDGAYSVREVMHHALEAGLDFIALTDHNTFSQNRAIDGTLDLAVIPGVELTTNMGHANFYGNEKPFKDFRCNSADDVKKVFHEGLKNQAIISANHPHCEFCPWEWGLEEFDFKVVEIWNGAWKESNHATLQWWQSQLEDGKRVVAVGGSDKHAPHRDIHFGTPTTSIKTISLEPKSLLQGLIEGKVSILSHPGATEINLTLEGKEIGQTVLSSQTTGVLTVNCEVKDTHERLLKFFSKDGLFKEVIPDKGDHTIQVEVSLDRGFYRTELWKYDKSSQDFIPECITNPVFVGHYNKN